MWVTILVVRRFVVHDLVSAHWSVHSAVGIACGWMVLRRGAFVVGAYIAAIVVAVPAWSASHDVVLGAYDGAVRIVEEPIETGALRVVIDVDGRRYVSYLYGTSAGRLSRCRFGDVVMVSGERRELTDVQRARLVPRHVVGSFVVDAVESRCVSGSPLARSANRVRDTLGRATASLRPDEAALLAGLVIGDDRHQPREMTEAFRAAGLSHLTAVSGQNVAFVLAVCGPLLRRIHERARFAVLVAIVAWFVVVTRCEPSVVRAGIMAVVAAYGSSRGFLASGERALALTVGAALIVDPLLSASVGFQLSTAATAGLVWVAPRITNRIPGPRWLAESLGVTVAAQIAVAPVSYLTFGTFNVVGLVTNMLAVPVAGFVMLAGLPVMGVCGLLVDLGAPMADAVARVGMVPLRLAVRWVWWVAVVASRL